MTDTNTSWLDRALNTASQLGSAYLTGNKPSASGTPKPVVTTEPMNWTKIATIGGAVVGVIALLFLIRKK